MKIAIIGSGNVGLALARGLENAGHEIILGARNANSPKLLKALEILKQAKVESIEVASMLSDVIIISTPAEVIIDILPLIGDISEKIIIDTTNAIRIKPIPYNTAFDALRQFGKANHVVKCFNSTGYENMIDPKYNGVGIDMFMAGDSQKAKNIAKQLALEIGFENCIDFGGDDKVELLEQLALSWINIAIMQGHGRNLAFKIVKR